MTDYKPWPSEQNAMEIFLKRIAELEKENAKLRECKARLSMSLIHADDHIAELISLREAQAAEGCDE